MIKQYLIAIILCSLPIAFAFSQTSYQISGTWDTGKGRKVYLNNYPSGTPEGECIDSVTVAADGSFRLSGELKEMQPLSLSIEGHKGYRALMGDGHPVVVHIRDVKYSYKNPGAAFVIEGDTIEHSAVAEIINFFTNDFIRKISMGGVEGEAERAAKSNDIAKKKQAEEKLKAMADKRENEKDEFLTKYGNTVAAPYFITMNLLKGIPVEETEEFYNRMGVKPKSSPKGIELKESIARMKALAPGAEAPEFTLPTVAGEQFSLKSLRGNIVILDFWASWCAPCIAEMPIVKEIYAQYKDKGLKVVGISMDNVKAAWVKSIDKVQIPWMHVSSLKGMKRCPVAQLYQVYAIPKLYIIDKEGKIIAKDLRGEDLKKKIDELFVHP